MSKSIRRFRRLGLSLAAGGVLFLGGCSLATVSQALIVSGVNSVFTQVFGLNSISDFSSSSPVDSSLPAASVPTSNAGILFSPGMLGTSTSILDFGTPRLF